jgi:dTDP-4-dehydrorhamnose 3,5-epimerase
MRQLFLPVGFGHAFLTLSDAEVQYKCTTYYAPETEHVIAWDDPDLAIDWPLPAGSPPLLSDRDRHGLSLRQYLDAPAFRY